MFCTQAQVASLVGDRLMNEEAKDKIEEALKMISVINDNLFTENKIDFITHMELVGATLAIWKAIKAEE
jgi:hypothetical protein